MFSNKLLYYIFNYILTHSFEREILKILKKEKKLVIFDVGCYRGVFTKTMLNLAEKRNYTLIKKANTLSISLFSNIKGGDYLFINNSYL